ncbi:MAG: hypothetical protein QXJ72_07565 [Thermoproteota archaeon]
MNGSEIGAEELLKKFKSIIDIFRYHVATGRFSYVDRIMAAMDPSVIEETLREAIRSILSAASNPQYQEGNPVKYDREKRDYIAEDKKERIMFIEKEELEKGKVPTRVFLHGKILSVEGKLIALYTAPLLPSDNELSAFFDAVRKNINVAKTVASLAMTIPNYG